MKVRKIPQRLCAACQSVGAKRELLRIVRSPEGIVSIDLTGKKPGRGVYICKNTECLAKAIKEKRLEKALRVEVNDEVRQGLLEEMEQLAKSN